MTTISPKKAKEIVIAKPKDSKRMWWERWFPNVSDIQMMAAIVFVLGLLCLLGILYFAWSRRAGGTHDVPAVTPTSTAQLMDSCPARRILDGVCVAVGDEAPPVVGVMIENAYDAWPLSGLASASVVYEAPVEGNIPRFLALYPVTTAVDKVGPVRSSRVYYLDWVSEYGRALYVHVGGSPEAMQRLSRNISFVNIDEFGHDLYMWRSTDRRAPHNTYTARDRWEQALEAYDVPATSTMESWVFTDATSTCATDCVNTITVSFYSPTYDAEWQYNSSTGKYKRYQNYREQLDSDGSRIYADTIIVQKTEVGVIDEVGRKELRTTGSGEALVFHSGSLVRGTWAKSTATSRTRWYDENGEEIALRPGKIWIEVIGRGQSVSWE